ncbi:MAG: CBS domain-containing protein [Bacteroidetes bacterium]|nr:CBS domain-containing protein [Bacteroidota bacterium]
MQVVAQMTARDVMTRDVLTVRSDWSIDRLAEFLIQNDISGAPVVVDGGMLVGVVSLKDIVRHNSLPETRSTENQRPPAYYIDHAELGLDEEDMASLRWGEVSSVQVRDIMTPAVFSVAEDASMADVADTMVRGRIHRVFVTRDGSLQGIITALDMLNVIRDDR